MKDIDYKALTQSEREAYLRGYFDATCDAYVALNGGTIEGARVKLSADLAEKAGKLAANALRIISK